MVRRRGNRAGSCDDRGSVNDIRAHAPIRIGLVDDQALFRAGIRMLVSSQSDLEFVGEAADGVQGIEMAASTRPDVVLMDIRMPVMDGIASTAAILQNAARHGLLPPRVIMLTTFDLDEAAARAIRGGASGFVLKDAEPEFLLAAIRTVHAGNAVIAAAATRELFERFAPSTAEPEQPAAFATLTSREREIFALAARGLSNGEIALGEYLSEATVKTHISRILAKLELRDRVQLVVYAFEHGLAG
jgi:DNA-binding NarL/FixJ family response regulator